MANTTLYKRNAKGFPIYWSINIDDTNLIISVKYGIVGKSCREEKIEHNSKDAVKKYQSLINFKIKEGYKELKSLYDNAPENLYGVDLYNYLNTYLPKFNTDGNDNSKPMLCKTLRDNKPFLKGSYFGQPKMNGERCIISATKENNLFTTITLHFRSREGEDWTDKLQVLGSILLNRLPQNIIDMMIEEGMELDGEVYLPGHGINEIVSIVKNLKNPFHNKLQFWCYDCCIEEASADERNKIITSIAAETFFKTKEEHLDNKNLLIIVPSIHVGNFNEAVNHRDHFIDLGFEGLVIREEHTSYQYGGKRNNAMLKFKKEEDGYFAIIDVNPDKRGLPIFTLKNDINEETFECTLNTTHEAQEAIMINKNEHIGKLALVEYRERSGVKQVPFHAKMIKIIVS